MNSRPGLISVSVAFIVAILLSACGSGSGTGVSNGGKANTASPNFASAPPQNNSNTQPAAASSTPPSTPSTPPPTTSGTTPPPTTSSTTTPPATTPPQSTTPSTNVAGFAYVANPNPQIISVFAIDRKSGVLSAIAGSPFASPAFSDYVTTTTALAIHPSGNYVYTLDSNEFRPTGVTAFKIDPQSGALTAIGSASSGGTDGESITVNPAGTFVYVAHRYTGDVAAFRVDADTGNLSPIPGSPFATKGGRRPFMLDSYTNTMSVTVHPSGQFVYAANLDPGNISVFRVDNVSGALNLIAGSPFWTEGSNPGSSGPSSAVIHSSGKFAYVANEITATVSAFRINTETGAPTSITGSPFSAGQRPIGVTIDSSGKFVYVVNDGSDDISAFAIDPASGGLMPVVGSPFMAGTHPHAIATLGRFIYVSNWSNTVAVFAIDPDTGALNAVEGSSANVTSPGSIATIRKVQ